MTKPLTRLAVILAATLALVSILAIASSTPTSPSSESPYTSPAIATTTKRSNQDDQQSSPAQAPVEQPDKSARNPATKQRAHPSRSPKVKERTLRPPQGDHSDAPKSPTRVPQTSKASANRQDPFLLAQQQARLMVGYNNTPPLFVTATRDLFVDIARFPLGTKVAEIKAVDIDGDSLEYSLQPAIFRDASPYFSIDSHLGVLRLDHKQFTYYADQATNRDNETVSDSEAIISDSDDESDMSGDQDGDESQQSFDHSNKRNLYFLNVVAVDGHYTSALELQIHVLNSSSLAMSRPVQLTPDGSRNAWEQMEDLLQKKTKEFYDKLNKVPENQQSGSSPIVVYPNFVNPGLIRPESPIEAPSTVLPIGLDEPRVASSTSPTEISLGDRILNDARDAQPQSKPEPPKSILMMPKGLPSAVGPSNDPQPMVVTLVVTCSCLMLALVLLMFIVPISVRRLRRRLRHVEMQHERLSHHGSSTVCSSSASSSSMTTHNHAPSLSQFTLGSDGSCHLDRGVCRQSSLDSNVTVLPPPRMFNGALNRVNNGSIANPVYLQQQPKIQGTHSSIDFSQPHLQQNPTFVMQTDFRQNYQSTKPCENIYYPLDDEFYSTINPDAATFQIDPQSHLFVDRREVDKTTLGQNAHNYHMAQYQPPTETPEPKRALESRNSDSGSSTRSLARFLSLPARHSNHQEYQQSRAADDLDGLATSQGISVRSSDQASKTIARTSHVSRERHGHVWELERHRLRFLEILDEGQFGMVWRCKLKLEGKEQTVAVKTLKKSVVRDERGREELLAEIEIMKRVCHHPNVVEILHCCTADTVSTLTKSEHPILLVMEYVELGKLQSFLEKSRINHNYATNLFNNFHATNDHLTSRDLVKFIYHIAKGMEYVSSQCIVHRDLASRNILVSSQRICKIGDFGMARHMQSLSGVYERHSRNAKIPVRWMAPEVLLNNKFTTKSDVFSFGILMWEIITLGSTPYRHLKTEQVIEAVARHGERPEKPVYCHPQLYQIMSRCWLADPDQRPTFSLLVEQLGELFLSANDYIELDQYPDHDYYNISKIAAPNELL